MDFDEKKSTAFRVGNEVLGPLLVGYLLNVLAGCTDSTSLVSHSSESEGEAHGRGKAVSLKVRYDRSTSSRAKISVSHRSRKQRKHTKGGAPDDGR